MSRTLPLVVGTLLITVALSTSARGETVAEVPNPRQHGSWVSDMADVLTGTEVTLINGAIDALEQENGAEIAVVTVDTTGATSAKAFAHELFNRWGVGKAGADNGVLVLLAKNDRRIEVETGYGAEGVLPDGKVGAILDEHAVPSFKRGDFGGGLVATTNALARELRKEEPAYAKAMRSAGISKGMALGILGALLAAMAVAVGFWLRNRPKKCPSCGRPMRLLTEEQEDAYLSRDQAFEEEIGAHDWRVWRCDDDHELLFDTRGGWLSSYSTCTACSNKTAFTTRRTVRWPSYTREGIDEVTVRCRLPRCKHTTQHTVVLPRRTRSRSTSYSSSSGWSSSSSGGWSSSSSSSFGGGSSGGGGAGRSW